MPLEAYEFEPHEEAAVVYDYPVGRPAVPDGEIVRILRKASGHAYWVDYESSEYLISERFLVPLWHPTSERQLRYLPEGKGAFSKYWDYNLERIEAGLEAENTREELLKGRISAKWDVDVSDLSYWDARQLESMLNRMTEPGSSLHRWRHEELEPEEWEQLLANTKYWDLLRKKKAREIADAYRKSIGGRE